MTWYKKGLYFKCLNNCAKCCTGSPGYVWLEDSEIEKISKFLKISKENFLKKYTKTVGNKISLLENYINFDCVFLKDKKCQIYEVRPKQCTTYPFWKNNLKCLKTWEDEKKYCPGLDDETGKLFTSKEIKEKIQ